MSVMVLIQEGELIAVEEQTAAVRQSVLPGMGSEVGQFGGAGGAAEGEFEGALDSGFDRVCLGFQTGGEVLGLADHKGIVPQGQCLLDGHAVVAGGGQLVAGRTV